MIAGTDAGGAYRDYVVVTCRGCAPVHALIDVPVEPMPSRLAILADFLITFHRRQGHALDYVIVRRWPGGESDVRSVTRFGPLTPEGLDP